MDNPVDPVFRQFPACRADKVEHTLGGNILEPGTRARVEHRPPGGRWHGQGRDSIPGRMTYIHRSYATTYLGKASLAADLCFFSWWSQKEDTGSMWLSPHHVMHLKAICRARQPMVRYGMARHGMVWSLYGMYAVSPSRTSTGFQETWTFLARRARSARERPCRSQTERGSWAESELREPRGQANY